MMLTKKIVVQLKVSKDLDAIQVVESLFRNNVKPDLVFLDMESSEFPDRSTSLPDGLMEFVCRNPKVKFIWDGKNPLEDDEAYEIIRASEKKRLPCDFVQKNSFSRNHEFIDMTMVSVFYDAGINPLRKEATKKAVACWMKQKHLPQEMMFVELGFNGEFTFSKEDFPKQINYVRIDGDDSHKYLFQKEHLWNIAAKRAKHEKLMFVDSDIAPLKDVDWFKQAYDALDRCLFTQGYNTVTYLDEHGNRTNRVKTSFTRFLARGETTNVNKSAPGGIFCIHKDTLKSIDYFNYILLGGGDILFINELSGAKGNAIWMPTLQRRDNVAKIVSDISKRLDIPIFGHVNVDVFHFYHGDSVNRSYGQRDYMISAFYPWMNRYVYEDDKGLLAWLDFRNKMFNVIRKMNMVNNEKKNAIALMQDVIDYNGFYNEIRKNIYTFSDQPKHVIVKEIHDLLRKYGVSRGQNSISDAKLSVVIPVYNGVEYIDRCLGSLNEQTYKNIEIICVDDCSTDGSYERLLKCAKGNRNMKVFRTKENSGCCSNPRNIGIQGATGEYIQFLDIDDCYNGKYVAEKLMSLCMNDRLDYLRFTFKLLNQQDNQDIVERYMYYYSLKGNKSEYVGKIFNGEDMYFKLKQNKSYIESACCCLIRKEILDVNGIAFMENTIHEDVLFTPMLLSKCGRCMQIEDQCYLRTLHDNSIVTTTDREKQKCAFRTFLDAIPNDRTCKVMCDLRKMLETRLKQG